MRWKHTPGLSEQRRVVSLTQPQTDRVLERVQNQAGAAVLQETLSVFAEYHWKEKKGISVAYDPLNLK